LASVYEKRGTWFVDIKDATGRRHDIATKKKGRDPWLSPSVPGPFQSGRCRARTCDPCRVKAVLYR
jgi:hypothetical protein